VDVFNKSIHNNIRRAVSTNTSMPFPIPNSDYITGGGEDVANNSAQMCKGVYVYIQSFSFICYKL